MEGHAQKCVERYWELANKKVEQLYKVVDVIARLPATDKQLMKLSAYTQVKLEDAPRLLRLQKSECPDGWIRLPRHKWPKSQMAEILSEH